MKKITALLTAFVLALSLTACGGTSPEESEAAVSEAEAKDSAVSETEGFVSSISDYDKNVVRIDGTKFTVDGNELWINGANTPWDKWNDFGGAFNESFWDEHFAMLHESGINASRVWINCNGVSIVRLNEDGTVKSVSKKHWEDLDKLFAIAEKHQIYLMPTLLSFDHFKKQNPGHERWRLLVQSDEATQSYIDSYVIPFVQRYGSSPSLWSIDLMNEPDWVKENAECGKIGWEHLCKFFAKCTAAIHENSDELVTVGAGMIKYNSDKYDGNYFSDEFFSSLGGEKAYLDFYSTHYYYWQHSSMGYPFDESPSDFGLDGTKPAVIGECAVLSESKPTIDEEYENAYNNGWNGVLAWTSNGVDDCGSMDDLGSAVKNMEDKASEKIFPIGKQ